MGDLKTPKFPFEIYGPLQNPTKNWKVWSVMLLKCSGYLTKLEFCCKNYWPAFFPLSLQQFWFWILLLHSGPFIIILSKKYSFEHVMLLKYIPSQLNTLYIWDSRLKSCKKMNIHQTLHWFSFLQKFFDLLFVKKKIDPLTLGLICIK